MRYTYSSKDECFEAILFANNIISLSIGSKDGKTKLFEKSLRSWKGVFHNCLIIKNKRDIDSKEGIITLKVEGWPKKIKLQKITSNSDKEDLEEDEERLSEESFE